MRQRALPRNHGPRVSMTRYAGVSAGLRQSSQEIAHLPPDAAAVLQAAGTKHENVDRGAPAHRRHFWPADRLVDITADDARPVLHRAYA